MKKNLIVLLVLILTLSAFVFGGCNATDDKYTVSFNSNGGSAVASQTVQDGKKATKPTDPTKAGYAFDSWYYQDEEWSFIGYSVTENMELKAKWNAIFNRSGNEITSLTAYGKTLTEIEIPNAIDGTAITSIGNGAFSSCSELESITIPSSVTSIGNGAFYNCDNLESVTIPNSVTSIGARLFWGCDSLESIAIPSGITSIGDSVFSYCNNLESVTIPSSVTSIGEEAFLGCDSLTSIAIPSGVTSIGNEAFSSCSSLESITIPGGVTSIGYRTFFFCSSLESITIPGGVTSIGEGAFSSCSSLESVTIPSGVTSLGFKAFSDCSSLTIYCEAESKPSGWDIDWNFSDRPVYWYSATAPTGTGNYWHYVDDEIVIWE